MTARRVTHLLLLATLMAPLNCLVSGVHAQQPSIAYQITRIPVAYNGSANATPRDINNLSMVVGSHTPNGAEFTGYVYDHQGLIGLPQTVHSLSEWIPNLDGWSRSRCMGINDAGQIVGYVESTIDGEVIRKGFYLDLDILSESPTPTWQYLPTPPNSTHYYGRKINNNGDVIVRFVEGDGQVRAYIFNPGDYDPTDPTTEYKVLADPDTGSPLSLRQGYVNINDSQQVVGALDDGTNAGAAFRLTPGDSLDPLPIILAPTPAINNAGVAIGYVQVVSGKGRKQTTTPSAVRVSPGGEPELINDNSYPDDLNQSGDVVGLERGERWLGFVYHSDSNGIAGHGLVYLDNVVTGSNDDLDFWFSANADLYQMNDRDQTGYGQIVVEASRQTTTGKGKNRTTVWESRCFLLTPVSLP